MVTQTTTCEFNINYVILAVYNCDLICNKGLLIAKHF